MILVAPGLWITSIRKPDGASMERMGPQRSWASTRVPWEQGCISSGSSGRRQKDQIRLSTSLQSLSQYIEVSPNIEVKPIVPGSFPLLSYSSNPLLSKDDSKLLIFPAVGKSFANTICMILVIIGMEVLSEKRMELSQTIASLSGSIRMEKGCQRCDFCRNMEDENELCKNYGGGWNS